MEIQAYQTIELIIYCLIFFAIYKINNNVIRLILVGILLISFFANPFRMKATPITTIERGVKRFDELPEKIIIKTIEFDEFNKTEINKLNKINEESKNEVHN